MRPVMYSVTRCGALAGYIMQAQQVTVNTSVHTVRALHDARFAPARALWLSGWGRSRFRTFGDYVNTVPPVPTVRSGEASLCRTLLVDTAVSLMQACQLLGIAFVGDDGVFVDMVHEGSVRDVRWAWWSPCALYTRQAYGSRLDGFPLQQRVVPLTAFEGVCLLAQERTALNDGGMLICAASWMCGSPRYRACFVNVNGEPTLSVIDIADVWPDRLVPGRLRL